jgi:hypothetical protein
MNKQTKKKKLKNWNKNIAINFNVFLLLLKWEKFIHLKVREIVKISSNKHWHIKDQTFHCCVTPFELKLQKYFWNFPKNDDLKYRNKTHFYLTERFYLTHCDPFFKVLFFYISFLILIHNVMPNRVRIYFCCLVLFGWKCGFLKKDFVFSNLILKLTV